MIKGYEVNLPVMEVQAIIEKALTGDGVKLPVFNEFAHTANAIFPEVGYAWISWKAKGENTSSIAIQAPKEVDVENAYTMLFESQKEEKNSEEKSDTKEEPVQEVQPVEEKKTDEKKVESKQKKKKSKKTVKESEQEDLSIDALGLKGKVAKDFAANSGCKTLSDVAKLSIEELSAIPGVGAKTIEKIVKEMKALGFKIK